MSRGKRFWHDVRALPHALLRLVRADGAAGRIHLLWGAASGLVAALVLSPSIGALLAVGFLAAAPTVIGSIVSSFGSRLFHALLHMFAPNRTHAGAGIQAVVVGLLGASAALVIGFVVTDTATKLALAVACGLVALVLQRRGFPPAAVTTSSWLSAVLIRRTLKSCAAPIPK